jgi:hypothetical protein
VFGMADGSGSKFAKPTVTIPKASSNSHFHPLCLLKQSPELQGLDLGLEHLSSLWDTSAQTLAGCLVLLLRLPL